MDRALTVRSLVVEDVQEVASYVAILLAEWNGIVEIVGSGEDAAEAFRHSNYDLALFDRGLPDGHPLHLIKALATIPERPASLYQVWRLRRG
jgi:DNA-binding response OmpR family regulator